MFEQESCLLAYVSWCWLRIRSRHRLPGYIGDMVDSSYCIMCRGWAMRSGSRMILHVGDYGRLHYDQPRVKMQAQTIFSTCSSRRPHTDWISSCCRRLVKPSSSRSTLVLSRSNSASRSSGIRTFMSSSALNVFFTVVAFEMLSIALPPSPDSTERFLSSTTILAFHSGAGPSMASDSNSPPSPSTAPTSLASLYRDMALAILLSQTFSHRWSSSSPPVLTLIILEFWLTAACNNLSQGLSKCWADFDAVSRVLN